MKNNFILKLLAFFYMLINIQFVYAGSSPKQVTLSFDFIYGQGINSVYFDQNNMKDEHSIAGNFTVTDKSSAASYELTVNTDVNNSGAKSITNNFNKYYSPRLEVGGSDSNASSLDFWFAGVLYINGYALSTTNQTFTFGHENHKSSNDDWWIADTSGKAKLYNSSEQFTSMTVQDVAGNYYCLSQNKSNFQIVVNTGSCDSLNYFSYQLNVTWGQGVNAIYFVPLESPESGQIEKVTNSISLQNGNITNTISVMARPLNSVAIANSFNSLMLENKDCWEIDNTVYDFELYVQGMVCGPAPEYLDFYIPGYLAINEETVVDPGTGNNRVFILAHGQNRWWLGTINAPFDYYGGGGATYNNHVTVAIPSSGKESYEGFDLKADSENSFKVNSSLSY